MRRSGFGGRSPAVAAATAAMLVLATSALTAGGVKPMGQHSAAKGGGRMVVREGGECRMTERNLANMKKKCIDNLNFCFIFFFPLKVCCLEGTPLLCHRVTTTAGICGESWWDSQPITIGAWIKGLRAGGADEGRGREYSKKGYADQSGRKTLYELGQIKLDKEKG